MVAADLTAAAEVVELARPSSNRARRPSRRRRTGRRPGARLRPRPRRRRRRDGPLDARLRRPGRRSRPQITCAFVADAVGELASRLFGREATWGVEAGALDGARAVLRHLPRPGVPRLARRAGGLPPPRRRLRAGAGHLPPLRRGEAQADRRAHPPPQRRHPRGHHQRPRRDGRLRPVDPRGVRRLRQRRRVRVHRHGRRHRGAQPRAASAPAAALITRPEILTRALRHRRHRGAEAASGSPSSPPPRS